MLLFDSIELHDAFIHKRKTLEFILSVASSICIYCCSQRSYHLHASTLVSLLLPRDLFSSHYLASASSLIVYLDRTTTYEEHSVPLSFVCCPLSTVCRYQVGHLDVEEAVGVLMLVDVGQSSGV